MSGTIRPWLMGLLALGAGYLVLTNPNGFFKAAQGIRQVVGGTESDVISGGKR